MTTRAPWFNPYFLLGLCLLGAGCATDSIRQRRETTFLRFHLETNPDGSDRTAAVRIGRADPFAVQVEKVAFLHENHVSKASVIEGLGGFQLAVQFDDTGSLLLEQYSLAGRGRHAAVYCQYELDPKVRDKVRDKGKSRQTAEAPIGFDAPLGPAADPKLFSRWIAAPLLSGRISNGLFAFTPDTTREEADRIARGLNNVAEQVRKGKR